MRDLEQAVAEQRFRQDLYYRLSVIVIRVPPLRERRGDIPLLVDQFLQRASQRARAVRDAHAAALTALANYDWPGNVRELENTIERLVVFSRGRSTWSICHRPSPPRRSCGNGLFEGLPTLDELERRYLLHVLQTVGGNRSRAAEALGIDRRTLYRMAERFGIDLSEETSG